MASPQWLGGSFVYDNPGTVSWAGQYVQATLGATGTWVSPFNYTATAEILAGPGSGTPISCSNSNIISYPVNAASGALGGTSQIVTCKNSYDSP
jgi:hypothetical protein